MCTVIGWVRCDRKTHQAIVNYLAEEIHSSFASSHVLDENRSTKMIWISVEYPLGPEHKYPIWLNESAAVTQYIIENKTSFGSKFNLTVSEEQ